MSELDALRGFAVAGMILMTSPGAWEFTYIPLQHADWHGWHFADFVFPDFLFGVGMALGLTFDRTRAVDSLGHRCCTAHGSAIGNGGGECGDS